jgi:UDP-N-acetylmuramate dehydrogenase
VRAAAPLSQFTTFRVGGTADWLVDVRSSDEIVRALHVATRHRMPVTLLGGGSNVLIGDRGIRGLVIRVHGGDVMLRDDSRVRADAGVTINALVRWTINRGLAGVEEWAGTPGTVGGGVYGNAHFQGRLLGELIDRVAVAERTGVVLELPVAQMEFAYDVSRLQRTGEVLLWAELTVSPGDSARLRETARESLAYRKRTQPLDTPSAGCIFQNPLDASHRLPDGVPASAGALIDRAGLKGHAIGGARVSPTHANFIINEGSATAADIRSLIQLCKRRVTDTFGIDLREEIVYLGEF